MDPSFLKMGLTLKYTAIQIHVFLLAFAKHAIASEKKRALLMYGFIIMKILQEKAKKGRLVTFSISKVLILAEHFGSVEVIFAYFKLLFRKFHSTLN